MARWIVEPIREMQEDGTMEKVPGVVRCGCGAHVTITHDCCECHDCDQLFNVFGQRLAPMNTWGDNYYRNYE